ncbi:MAG: Ni/Fe hydrogenase subunit alpha [Nitrosomonadaceae bacterium]|nr:Ni/Fe hydrogenase subunit alpha [Nitrosomonadaceae bacterium]
MEPDKPASSPATRRITIDPVTRVEGHGKITLLIDDHNHIIEARFHIVEFRGFEKFIQGRPYWEVPFFVQRLCGICPVSHQLAAGKAVAADKALTLPERDTLLAGIDDILQWSQEALALNEQIHTTHPEHRDFGTLRSHYLSMTGSNGELEFYHGGLRARATDGSSIFDQFDYCDYQQILKEEVRSWSYLKFPYFSALGTEQGWYRVGPLARINNCDRITTPLAEAARLRFRAYGNGGAVHDTLAYHWARMIELLHCAESIHALLHDTGITSTDLMADKSERQPQGIGVIEAPRGTLFHHYQVNEEGLVTQANLIVSTTSNNQAMNESVRVVANQYLDGQEITEALLNHLEVAVRAYDPCLSCATHALGKMPLQVTLQDTAGKVIHQLTKGVDGAIQ